MQQQPHRYAILIKEADLDTLGHVNNARYLSLLEEARWDWVTNNGYGLRAVKETGIGPVILEISMRFLKEISLRDSIVIESLISDVGKKTFNISHKILRNDELCFTAEFKFALFDLNIRKIIEMTPAWLAAFQ